MLHANTIPTRIPGSLSFDAAMLSRRLRGITVRPVATRLACAALLGLTVPADAQETREEQLAAQRAEESGLPRTEGAFITIELSAVGTPQASWERLVHAYFRLRNGEWRLVGFERLPER